MEVDRWIGAYKVRAFPWIDKKRIYVNVQYFAPGQSVQQPPVWDKTIYVTDDDNGRRLVYEFTDTLVENISRMVVPPDAAEITLTVESGPPSILQPPY
jgi:hypothetical protein